MAELARLSAITKSFGGIHALRGVDFAVEAGEVHALLGENGAGKSTLMRVLGGEMQPTSGTVALGGETVTLRDPRDARTRGIAVIHQELALAPDLTVAENIFLGELPGIIGWGPLKAKARALLDRLGFAIDPGRTVGSLAVAHQQVVEIAKALAREVRIIVFDEPTAVLSAQDAERLHGIIADLKRSGVGVVYISHRLDEVMRIADRMTVMKDGQLVGTVAASAVTVDELIRMMVGRPLAAMFPEKGRRALGETLVEVKDLRREPKVRGVSFKVRAGEVVGLGGLVGAGRTEVARLIFGADRPEGGEIRLRGEPVRFASPREAVAKGIGLVPEDRKHEGVVLDNAIRINATMARMNAVTGPLGVLKRGREKGMVEELGRALRLKSAGVDAPVSSLSGGNQQKVVLAKWFHAEGQVIILDEPTRGVDVGAKTEIYALIDKLATSGKAVLVISSEHQELFGLCDRVLVMGEGELRGELLPDGYSEANLLSLAMIRPVADPSRSDLPSSRGAAS